MVDVGPVRKRENKLKVMKSQVNNCILGLFLFSKASGGNFSLQNKNKNKNILTVNSIPIRFTRSSAYTYYISISGSYCGCCYSGSPDSF